MRCTFLFIKSHKLYFDFKNIIGKCIFRIHSLLFFFLASSTISRRPAQMLFQVTFEVLNLIKGWIARRRLVRQSDTSEWLSMCLQRLPIKPNSLRPRAMYVVKFNDCVQLGRGRHVPAPLKKKFQLFGYKLTN